MLQWNPSITDTIGSQQFVHYSKVSLTQGLPSVGVVLCNHAAEHNVAVFTLLYAGYPEASTMRNSATLYQVVNSSSDGGQMVECPLNQSC